MTLLAGFQALLGRLSGQEDVVVGTDLANRTQFATEKLIGFFVNLLPIRTRLGGDPKFTELLARVRESSLGAFANQDAPFEELVKELQPERNLNHHPLVQVLFVMQNTPQGPREFGGLKAGPLGVSSTSRFDLVLFINNPEATPLTTWMYNPNLFDASTIARMADLYEQLLRSVAEQPEAQLSRINDALDEAEHRWHEAEQKAFQETSLRKLKGVRRRTPLVPVDGDSDQA
jgi:non-ribosomal peptide synthetase component F